MGTDTLVDDIYSLMRTKRAPQGINVEEEIEKFGEGMKEIMKHDFLPHSFDARKLRMSNIGKTDRYLWHHFKGFKGEKIQPHTLIKFLYGHLIEEMLLFLVRMSGHEVTDEQKKAEVEGLVGHMDCKIDGIVTDVKSTSSYGFKKFQDGTLAFDDPFGYIDQLKGYAKAEDAREMGWLAMDKQNGHLTFLKYNLDDTQAPVYEVLEEDIVDRIKHIKEMVKQPEPPEHCYPEQPDGKSGNMKLSVGCSYCQFKKHCYPDLRAFAYSTGPRFLTKVANQPKVMEIDLHEHTV